MSWRLEYSTGRSVGLVPPYLPIPSGLNIAAAPSRLLYAEHGLVPYCGARRGLVDELVQWCLLLDDYPGISLLTLVGTGGSGKTRLAAEACLAVSAHGWDAGAADANRPAGSVRWQLQRPTLIVIDNADLNLTLTAELIKSLSYASVPVRLRPELLSPFEPWRERLDTLTGDLARGIEHHGLTLDEHRLDVAQRAEHYEAAVGRSGNC